MLQDITPHQFNNNLAWTPPNERDYVLVFQGNQVLLDCRQDKMRVPDYASIQKNFPDACKELTYLFSIDERKFYLSKETTLPEIDGFAIEDIQIFRRLKPSWLAFAGVTGSHLNRWYNNHKYCGRCAAPMEHSEKERALSCPDCGLIEYPKISPAVIVGIIDGNRILLTKSAIGAYRKYALIAGFMEIGETFEDTVKREVMEEVGLKVKNIRYYKSQPWAFSDSVLAGFFVDLDGSDQVTLQLEELAEATWFEREDIPVEDQTNISLTHEMIRLFKNGEV